MGDIKDITWEEKSRESVFFKYGRGVDKVVYRMPDGGEADFYIKNEKAVSCVLAITGDSKVLIVRQFRPGPGRVLSDIPGGVIDPSDKNPEMAVKRELLEETGYEGEVEFVTVALDDAYSNIERHCFVAKNCRKVADAKSDAEEFIQLDTCSVDEFRDLLRSGQMTDVEVGYLGLDYLGLL